MNTKIVFYQDKIVCAENLYLDDFNIFKDVSDWNNA